MQDESSRSPHMDSKIQMALSHPRRTEIFAHLIREKDGTSEDTLAAEFGMGIRTVGYHLKVLHDAALITRLDEEREPGTACSYVATSAF